MKQQPIEVSVQVYRKSGNAADYFVQFKCADRSVTPHKFTERYQAEYEAAYYRWVFTGTVKKPYLMDYTEASYPNYTEEQLKNPELRNG